MYRVFLSVVVKCPPPKSLLLAIEAFFKCIVFLSVVVKCLTPKSLLLAIEAFKKYIECF